MPIVFATPYINPGVNLIHSNTTPAPNVLETLEVHHVRQEALELRPVPSGAPLPPTSPLTPGEQLPVLRGEQRALVDRNPDGTSTVSFPATPNIAGAHIHLHHDGTATLHSPDTILGVDTSTAATGTIDALPHTAFQAEVTPAIDGEWYDDFLQRDARLYEMRRVWVDRITTSAVESNRAWAPVSFVNNTTGSFTWNTATTSNNCIIRVTGPVNGAFNWEYTHDPIAADPAFAKREQIRRNLRPHYQNHRGSSVRAQDRGRLFADVSANEILALQLLRKMVTPEVFRRYLKQGFITTQGPSGLTYQISRNTNERIKVWYRGVLIAHLCVHLKDVPPTDEVIAKSIIVECDEPDIWRRANISTNGPIAPLPLPLLESLGLVVHHEGYGDYLRVAA